MTKLFSLFDQVHRPELSDVVVDEAGAICELELDMVVFFGCEVFVAKEVFALHAEMGDDGVVL